MRAGQLAQLLRQLVLIAVALLLPRLNVDVSEIGQWEQMQYLGYLFGFAWLTGTGQAYLARVRSLEPVAAQELTSRLLRITLGFSILICLFAFVFQGPVLHLLTGDEVLPGWAFYLLFLASHWPALMYEQVLLAQSKGRRLIWFSVLSNLALLLAMLLPLFLGYSWLVSMRCLALVALFKAVLMLDGKVWRLRINAQKQDQLQTDTTPAYSLFSASLPLILYAVIGSVIVSFDPWLVNYWYEGDESQFAIYRYGTRELPLIAAVAGGIGSTVLPMIGKDRAAGLAQLRKSSLRLMHLFFPFTLLLILSSPWWWEPLLTPKFADSLPLFQVFLLSSVSRFIMPMVIITGTGHGKVLPYIGVVEFILNAVFSCWLVSVMGLAGIVWATVIVYTLDKLIGSWYIYRKEGVKLSEYCAWPWLLGYTVLLAMAYTVVSL